MNEGGDFDKLGRGCIWDDAIKPCIHQNHVFAVRPHSVRPSWLNLYTSSMQANAYFISRSKQSTNLASISSSNLMELMVPITSDIETTQIIHFLEIETAKIDALITEQQRLIQLLEEKRQAMISHAVTKGLTPDIPMKDSGGEWFGEVPEHWKTCKLSYVADVIDPNPSHRNPEYTNSGFPFISTIEFRPNGAIDFDAPRRVSEDTVREQEERCRFREGSLAFSRKGTIGAVRELPTAPRFALLDSLCVINPSATCTSQYLRLYLESLSCEKQLESLMRGAALPQVSVGDVRRLCLPLPPHDEQQAIADYLRAFVARLDKLIEAASSSRTLLQERRSALISAAVTGQIDVRGLAPVETPE
jgi:type I restriction enzyme S subunit